MRVGIGYDIHRLAEGRRLILGGIEIPYVKGLAGHSDGDVLIHAICDSLLGAAGMEDIGVNFPVNDPKYDRISSLELLKEVDKMIGQKGFKIDYVDTVLILEEPRIAPFKERMRECIAEILKIEKTKVNIKATTQEGVGAIGRGEAIATYAVACLENI